MHHSNLTIIGFVAANVNENGALHYGDNTLAPPSVTLRNSATCFWTPTNFFESVSVLQKSLQQERYTDQVEVLAVAVKDKAEFFDVLTLGRSIERREEPPEQWTCTPAEPLEEWEFLGYEVTNGYLELYEIELEKPWWTDKKADEKRIVQIGDTLHGTYESAAYYIDFLYDIDYEPDIGAFMVVGLFSVTRLTFDGPGLTTPPPGF